MISWLRDSIAVIGCCLIVYGTACYSKPAAMITAGVAAVVLAVLGSIAHHHAHNRRPP